MSVVPQQLSALPPALARDAVALVRALVAAARTRQLYAVDHPTSALAISRLHAAVIALRPHDELKLGISATSLLVNGEPLPDDPRIREAATLLHGRDVLALRFSHAASRAEVSDFLHLLTIDADVVRKRGGPARMWQECKHPSIDVQQIDYTELLGNDAPVPVGDIRGPGGPGDPDGGDNVWRAIVRSMATRRPMAAGAAVRQRLIQIAKSTDAILALTSDALRDQPPALGSALAAARAATVLTTFQRLINTVRAHAPEHADEVLRNCVAAASKLDAALLVEAIGESAESGLGADVIGAIGANLDDGGIAKMLTQALAADGRASSRLAAALATLAPDPARQQRVLRLAREQSTLGGESASSLQSSWSSLEQMLGGPGGSAYTSAEYSGSLEETDARSHHLRMQTPPQMDAWIQSVSAESVRTLSVTLLLDLFALEGDPEDAASLAGDLAALAEDLLMSTDFREAERVVQALRLVAPGADPRRVTGARQAVESVARSDAMRGVVATVADLDDAQSDWLVQFCAQLGPAVLSAVVPALTTAADGLPRERLETVVARFGEDAVPAIVPLLAHSNWAVCRSAIHLVGRIGGAPSVSALLPIIKDPDVRKSREAIATLVKIDHPHGSRALAAMLKTGTNEARGVVIDAIGAGRTRRASLLLATALNEMEPLGRDHVLALRLFAALRLVADDHALSAIARTMRVSSWVRWMRVGRLKRAAVAVVASMVTPAAAALLDQAIQTGDLRLRRYARAVRR